ncbi:MAG: hypothetical protein GY928_34100 [Colwellia sp.]|nr:hypothetical protein [Colwellia sp.]
MADETTETITSKTDDGNDTETPPAKEEPIVPADDNAPVPDDVGQMYELSQVIAESEKAARKAAQESTKSLLTKVGFKGTVDDLKAVLDSVAKTKAESEKSKESIGTKEAKILDMEEAIAGYNEKTKNDELEINRLTALTTTLQEDNYIASLARSPDLKFHNITNAITLVDRSGFVKDTPAKFRKTVLTALKKLATEQNHLVEKPTPPPSANVTTENVATKTKIQDYSRFLTPAYRNSVVVSQNGGM